ncbi:DUF2164 domain-containing protein [Paenibacillus harenae]|uniref:DUF2164 domain-containing protein n=1 Tax=Paenibacillus harenae TaxID=306543 RepID=UPI0004144F62|nr:DUF2164 domain-containing protein [Paenibacillus harenae]
MMGLKLPKEQKERLVASVQQYFELERSEEIGSIAAEQLLDFMIKEIGPHLYNHAIQDARKTVIERMQSLEDELYALEKPLTAKR